MEAPNDYYFITLWIETLKRVPFDQWNDEVKKDFASCLEAGMTSEEWWHEHRWGLFNGRPGGPDRPRHHKDAKGQILEDPGFINVRIDVRCDDERIYDTLAWMIAAHREDIGYVPPKGRAPYYPREAKYRFELRPDSKAWQISLRAFDIRRDEPDLAPWEIGLKLTNEFPIGQKARKAPDGVSRRRDLNDLAVRYLRRADEICTNIAKHGVYK